MMATRPGVSGRSFSQWPQMFDPMFMTQRGLQILRKPDLLSPEHPALVLAEVKHLLVFHWLSGSKDTERQQRFANVICATLYTGRRMFADSGGGCTGCI
jgi:hypothetical protein